MKLSESILKNPDFWQIFAFESGYRRVKYMPIIVYQDRSLKHCNFYLSVAIYCVFCTD
jgi:hypothetical protein